jgi:ornithine cyclodeaminase/alanine dehydrogenase-like protein (mu-crystallin family)
MTLMLSRSETIQHLVIRELIDQMELGFLAFAKGEVELPQRIRLMTSDGAGYGAFMPCYMPDVGMAIKVNSNFRENPERHGLPRILGLLLLLDTATGFPLAVMDSTAITAYRTAAVSALAVHHLAREDASVLGVLGSGTLSIPHISAVCAVRRVQRVSVYSPHLAKRREEFLSEARNACNCTVEIAGTARDVVAEAEILVLCTSSTMPVLEGKWLRPGTCVVAVGNATANTRELDTRTVARSAVVCDSWKACVQEAGDFVIPLKQGAIREEQLRHDLGEVLQGQAIPRASGETILFKSVGLGFQDLIAARHVYSKAMIAGGGTSFDFYRRPAIAAAS